MTGDARPLAGQRVAIVGGTSGMGRGAARAAADAGADVIALGRRPASKTLPERNMPGSILFRSLDMTDDVAVEHVFEELGTLDHLLVTATPPGPGGAFLSQSLSDAEGVLRGKLLGSWSCARHAAPRMRKGGSITFTTGGLVTKPRMGASMMMVAFAGLEALTRALALELGPIRVNAIRPGVIDSECGPPCPQPSAKRSSQWCGNAFPYGAPERSTISAAPRFS